MPKYVMVRMIGDDDYRVIEADTLSKDLIDALMAAKDHTVIEYDTFEIKLIERDEIEV